MTTENKDQETEEETQQPVLEPAQWVGGLIPLFVLPSGFDGDQAIEDIRLMGYQVFYILGEKVTISETGKGHSKKTTKSVTPALFRVVTNLVGNAVTTVNAGSIGLGELDNSAFFTLPGIPWELIRDVDDFFRAVEEEHNTEAIVLFTYDEKFKNTQKPEDGWGVVVPEQENTSGSCDYKPESVVEQLPDDPHQVSIVGSAHSHPGMSAYCSGTDKADQASFDGIHITFGWKASSRQTEFHIELQMGGAAYNLKEDFAFTGMPDFEKNKRIEPWKDRVKKKGTKTTTTTTYAGGGSYNRGPANPNYDPSAKSFAHLPYGLPEPDGKNTIVIMSQLKKNELDDCPVCTKRLATHAKQSAKCTYCQSYIATLEMTEGIDDILELREKQGIKESDLDVDDMTAWKSIWLWKELDSKSNAKDEISLLREGRAAREDHTSKK